MQHFGVSFWGEKNNGFDVLYHNMKHGQISVKELADFVRERALIEESYSKSMCKLAKMVSSNTQLGTFSPMWDVFRISSDKLALCHWELVRKLQELIKEMNRFSEDQVKVHRKTKEEVSGTLEAVQNIQASVQLLQKSKENYHSKWMEWDRLKKEGATQKETDKAEVKSKKAAETYKNCIEKYSAARADFEQKMTETAQKFQMIEEGHLRHMKGLINSFSHSVEDTHVQVGQVHEEFKQNVENIRVEDLIRKFAETKGTGKEKPGSSEFEECNSATVPEVVKKSRRKTFIIPGLTRKEKDNDSVGSPDADSINSPEVDEEGYTIRPDITQNSEKETDFCSSSDSDFDDDEPRRFHVQIKPALPRDGPRDTSASVEVLKASIGNIVLSANPSILSKRNSSRHSVQMAAPSLDGNAETLRARDEEGLTFRVSTPSPEPNRIIGSQNGMKSLDPLFGPPLETSFEKLGFGAQFNQVSGSTLSMSPPPLASSIPEAIEDSGLDSPSQPITEASSPSPQSRPWTPQVVTPPIPPPINTSFSSNFEDVSFATSCGSKTSEAAPIIGDVHLEADHPCVSPTTDREASPAEPDSEPDLSTLQPCAQIPPDSTSTSGSRSDNPMKKTPTLAPRRRHSKKKLLASQQGNPDTSRSLAVSPSPPPSAILTPMDNGSLSHALQSRPSTPAISACISRGPSPVTLGSQDSLPVAAAFTECINAYFRGGDFNNVIVKITGDVTMSFPAGIGRSFSGNPAPLVISFRLVNTQPIEQFLPNAQLLYSDLSQSDHNSRDFWLDMSALTAQLQMRAEQNPGAPYFNISLLKYQLSPQERPSAPLNMAARWRSETATGRTEVVMDYEYNGDAMPERPPLRNLQVLLPVEGAVSEVQSHPPGSWNPEQKRLLWKLPDISGQSAHLASVTEGPSKPSPLALQFTSEGSTLSGVDICLVGAGYRLSLVKKKLVTGKYFAGC
eukprot:gi/632962144/ref/XP_007897146.1/ PREDICTED: FCH domain only protein 1 [Callorhinchus milii]